MKVICIDDNWNKGAVKMLSGGPKCGETVTVVCEIKAFDGTPCYLLSEYSYSFIMWEQENFAPLSEIDELELVNQREEICQ